MSDLPSFTFPPSERYPSNGTDDSNKYIQSEIWDGQSIIPPNEFGSLHASMHTHDIIAPRWTEAGETRSIQWLTLHCMVCEYLQNAYLDVHQDVQFACTIDETDWEKSTVKEIIADPGAGGDHVTISLPEPEGSWEKDPNNAQPMACSLALDLNPEPGSSEQSQREKIFSALFWARHRPRTDERQFTPYIYNSTYPLGTPSIVMPATTPIPTPKCEGSGRHRSCQGDGKWDGWPIRNRVGVIIGAVAGFFTLMALVWYCCGCKRPRWEERALERRDRQKPMLLSEYRVQQQREREERDARAARLIAVSQHPTASPVPGSRTESHVQVDDTGDKPPPAYNEAVNDLQHFLPQHAVQSHVGINDTPPYSPLARDVDSSPPPVVHMASNDPLPRYAPQAAGTTYHSPSSTW